MFTVTLTQLRQKGACYKGYNKVVRMIQGQEFSKSDASRESYIFFAHEEEISLIDIANNNGLDDALWATQCLVGHDRDLRLYAVWCSRQVEHLSDDTRVKHCNDVAEKYANGSVGEEELEAAREAAREAASDEAKAAAWAAREASWTAWAAREASWIAWYATSDAARDAQKEMFFKMCKGEAPWQKGVSDESSY